MNQNQVDYVAHVMACEIVQSLDTLSISDEDKTRVIFSLIDWFAGPEAYDEARIDLDAKQRCN